MSDELIQESAEEKAFFESGGTAAPENKPETQPDAKEQEKPKAEEKPEAKEDQKYVPLGALHEERAKRRELQDKLSKMEGRFEDFLKRMQQGQTEHKPPSWDDAPIDAGKHTAQKVETLEEKLQRLEQKEQTENAMRAFQTRYAASAQEFMRENRDFAQAYQYWTAHVAQELQDAGWTDPAQIAEQVQNFERTIAAKAFEDGVNPAQRLYNIAKRRGYSSKAPDKAPQSVDEKIETLEKGAKAAKSLNAAGGGSDAPLTLESLAEMDDEDFDKNWDKVMKAARARK